MQVRLDMLVGDYIRNADRAGKATLGIASAAEKPKSALDRIGDAGKAVGRTMVTTAGIGVTAMAAWTASAIGAGVAYNSLQQTAGSALETLLGSAEAATAQMEELAGFARTSPFPRQMWIQAQQTLIGFGVEAERIVPIFEALQDGVVAVGGSAQQIDEVVQILAKMSTVGRVTADDLNELGIRGIDAATLVGDAWDMSAAQLRDSISQGTTDATTFIDTLVTQMSDRYGGAAEGLRTTWVGALDRIAGATRDFGAVLAEPFIDPSGGGAAVDWANAVADAIRALESIARPAMEVLSTRAEPAFQAAADAAGEFADAIKEVDLVAIIDRVSEAAPVLGAFAASAAAAGSASVLSAVGMVSLAGAISPVAAGVGALAVLSPELRGALVDLLGALAPIIPPAVDLAVQLAALVSSGSGLAGSILSVLAPALSALITAITPLIQFTSGLVQMLDAIPGPALAAAAGVIALAVAYRSIGGMVSVNVALSEGLDKVRGSAERASASGNHFRGVVAGLASAVVVGGLVALVDAFDDTANQLERVRSVSSSGIVEDLEHLARTGEASAGLAQLFGEGADAVDGFARNLDIATASASSWSNWWNVSGNERDAAKTSFQTLDAALAETVKSGEDADAVLRDLAAAYNLNEEQIEVLLGLLPQYTAEADRQARASEDAADAADEHADGLAGVEDQAESTRMSLSDLADEMRAQTDPVFAAIKATNELTDAEREYYEAVDEFGRGSDEANDAMMKALEARSKAAAASIELAEVTGGELTPEMLALADSLDLTADEMAHLTEQIEGAERAGEDYVDAYMDINASLTESTGQMRVANAIAYEGMDQDQADFVAWSIARIDELMDAGWSYEQALSQVAQQSNRSQEMIEWGFEKARDAGRDFSDEYPAHISLSGDDQVKRQIEAVKSLLAGIDRTVNIAFNYTSSGDWRNYMPRGGAAVPYSTGGPVGGPLGAGDVVPALLTPGEHVWTRSEVDAAGGHGAMESLRSAVLSGQTSHAQAGPASVSVSGGSAVPAHFTATAFFDLGEGVQRVMDVRFERHDRELTQRARQGAGARR